MKKFLNGIALALCALAMCVFASCPALNNPPVPDPVKCTITYDANGRGIAPESKKVDSGYKLTAEDLPSLKVEGYDCTSWKIGDAPVAVGYEVKSDITLKAEWTPWGKVAVPAFSVETGFVDYGDTVSLSCGTSGADIYYTLDGSTPIAASTKYTAPIAITSDVTIKAIATKTGMTSSEEVSSTYVVKIYTITFDADGHGTAPDSITGKHKGETITLAELTESGYTFDGWTDGTNSFAAGTEYTITADATLKAKWIGWNDVATPAFSVTNSAVDYGDTVSLSCGTSGADIYYTLDGSTPASSSTKYTAPIAITSDDTIKAIALKTGMNNSAVAEKTYTIKKYTITFDANGHGTAPDSITGKHKGETITLAELSESGYTFDGWTDGTNSFAAGTEYTITADATLKAKWIGWSNVATPVFSVASGAVTSGTNVTITCATEGAKIYYTTDGNEPTSASTEYKSTLTVTSAVTIKAIAVKDGMNNSAVSEVSYTVDVTPPAAITNLTATSIASQTVKLTWTNPTDSDFAKVVITYDTDKNFTVLKTSTPNNEATITGLTNGTEYTFSVKAYDNADNASSGVSENATPYEPTPAELTQAGTRPQNVQGKETLPAFIVNITDHMYLSSSSINTTGYIAALETTNVSTYQWYTGTTGNWQKIASSGQSATLQITVTEGTTYYIIEAKSEDGNSIAYSNVCTVVCGGEKTTNIGKIAYKNGDETVAYSDYNASYGIPIGIVFDVNEDGSPKKIVNPNYEDNKTICIPKSQAYNKVWNTSLTDGSVNRQIICNNVDDEDTKGLYRAFEYCDTLGEGWYIPARDELMTMCFNQAAVNAAIKILKDNGISATELVSNINRLWFFSSSQYAPKYNYVYSINFINGVCHYYSKGSNIPLTCAVRKF